MADQPTDAPAAVLPHIDAHVILLFGVTGDLAKRKLLPGLYHLFESGLMPEFRVVGASRSDITDDDLRKLARDATEEFGRVEIDEQLWGQFAPRLTYVNSKDGPVAVAAAVKSALEPLGSEARVLHYLSIPPAAAEAVVTLLDEAGLVEGARIIMEKPFGSDFASARDLNARVHQVFDEDQIFRIDHFLGKEAAQNILALRFANGLFEPIWNLNHIDHVQIDVPEMLSVEDRGAFYDATGAFRDMVVTHLFQILAFVAMEPPTALDPESIRMEKIKVFRSMRELDPERVVRGQYEGYREHDDIAPDSGTETFIAMRCEIDNWRWSGVPFYLRTGKRLAEGWRIISIAFREPPQSMFPPGSGVGSHGPDHLTFDLDESARLSLSFYGKKPGPGMTLDKQSLQFSLTETDDAGATLEAYERLIRDAMMGDHTLFTSAQGIERLWEISQPMLDANLPAQPYEQGSWGPAAMHDLIAPHKWRLPFARHWRGPLS